MVNYYLEKIKSAPEVRGKVCVIGLGYIGLPTAALLANRGYNVIGVDVNEQVVKIINSGKIHIKEPWLDTFVHAAIQSNMLKAFQKPQQADIFIIAVPTPFHKSRGNIPAPNLNYVINSINSIAPYLNKGNIIILESTLPVGTTEKIVEILSEIRPDLFIETPDIYIAHCPERVLPGKIIKELVENDRIVGGINKESSEKVAKFYKTFVSGEVLITNAKTAELCKLVENSYRDLNIAFANELSMICDTYGIDIWELRNLANRHPRVNILYPGVGVGGHCIAVDPWFIVSDIPEKSKLIRTAREINLYKTEWVIEKIKNEVLKFQIDKVKKPIIACIGLTFKADVDDLRESPALYIAQKLSNKFNSIICVEPNISKDYFEKQSLNINLKSFSEALEIADIIVILVPHKEIKEQIKKCLPLDSNKILLDFCGVKL